jgi:hypothetical protein
MRTVNGHLFIWPTQYYPALADRLGQHYPDIEVRVGGPTRSRG